MSKASIEIDLNRVDLFIGIDIGTSGIRAVCVDSSLYEHASAKFRFDSLIGQRTDPDLWKQGVLQVVSEVVKSVPSSSIRAVAVDGTSGTVLLTDRKARPLCHAMMYNDTCEDPTIIQKIEEFAPPTSAAHGASSGLAKAIVLSRQHEFTYVQHEADWITSCLSGQAGLSDENNALKTGYDPVSRSWPSWIENAGMSITHLPSVLKAGAVIGNATGELSQSAGLPDHALVVAGTTDGCASFLATGACQPGDGVTVLGSTLTIKLLSKDPIYSPEHGVYSHRIGDTWLAGGASNTGGAVLEKFFSATAIAELSSIMEPDSGTGLDYYPLRSPGERFPFNDSHYQPRLLPRPASDVEFLQGMFEGISRIEHQGYRCLSMHGGPVLHSIRTVGGGAANSAWTRIRQKQLDVPFKPCLSDQAAVGAAVLARNGAKEAGITKE